MYFDEVIEGENFDFTINNQAKVILLILLFIITFFIFYPSLLVSIVSGISLI
jgi:sugar phosphate permease